MTPRKAASVGLLVEHIAKRWGLYRGITPTATEIMLLEAIGELLTPSTCTRAGEHTWTTYLDVTPEVGAWCDCQERQWGVRLDEGGPFDE